LSPSGLAAFRVQPLETTSTYSRSVLGAIGNLAIPDPWRQGSHAATAATSGKNVATARTPRRARCAGARPSQGRGPRRGARGAGAAGPSTGRARPSAASAVDGRRPLPDRPTRGARARAPPRRATRSPRGSADLPSLTLLGRPLVGRDPARSLRDRAGRR